MKLGGWHKVFEMEYSLCDYLRVSISLPGVGLYEDHGYGETTKCCVLSADNKASFLISRCHWYVGLQVLGFGLSVKRQWDY